MDDQHAAEELYRTVLPLVVFLFQSLQAFVIYGKTLAAQRMGIEAHFRAPIGNGSDAGRKVLERLAGTLANRPIGQYLSH
jgi:hypothetical protein